MNDNNAKQPSWAVEAFENPSPATSVATAGVQRNWPRRDLFNYNEEVRVSQSSLIGAIAQDISKIRGGRLTKHLPEAWRLLEHAFRKIEPSNQTIRGA